MRNEEIGDWMKSEKNVVDSILKVNQSFNENGRIIIECVIQSKSVRT